MPLLFFGVALSALVLVSVGLTISQESKWARESGREPFHETSGKWQPGAQGFLAALVVAVLVLFIVGLRLFS